ncbi:hypothetical protein E2C01_010064 [Portunus trituberculatus]|uniref:Uncharacterized protein n=1 Tax=Portunus trituberculatus TaxID=210409 RepID=A0A5B7D7H3_PORTR|nr:hypothetical protein [Portunus trituberculatus]
MSDTGDQSGGEVSVLKANPKECDNQPICLEGTYNPDEMFPFLGVHIIHVFLPSLPETRNESSFQQFIFKKHSSSGLQRDNLLCDMDDMGYLCEADEHESTKWSVDQTYANLHTLPLKIQN